MCTQLVCLVVLFGTVLLVEPARAETAEEVYTRKQPLCRLASSAAAQAQLEEGAAVRSLETEIPEVSAFDSQPTFLSEEPPLSGSSNSLADRRLFERFLVAWLFFQDLAAEQRALIGRGLARCRMPEYSSAVAASVFWQFDASQRATFVGVTHAMLNTRLVDHRDNQSLGNAMELVEELVDIQGERDSLPSDHQFQLLVRLAPGAAQKLAHAAHFERGENRIYHKEYPISFRQLRQISQRGKEAGLHFCLTRDGRFAQIHIDYRFGLLHLFPTNSDVRAEGNHQRHVDRWPEFGFAIKRVNVRRVVLQRGDGV